MIPLLRPLVLAALLVASVLAGCAQPSPPDAPAATTPPTVEIDEDRPDTSFGDVQTGPAVGPDMNATLDAPPRLVEGEWWRIRFQSEFFDEVPEVVRIVADAHPDGYVMGMPHEGWFKEAMAYHFPAFGDVALDLSYDTHNVRFEPLRFPLREGGTWTTHFGPTEYTAVVESVDGPVATIRYDPASGGSPGPADVLFGALLPDVDATIRMTYDARQHEVVKFEADFIQWEVIEHGYEYAGWVTVPRGMHTAIDYGQFLPATPGEPPVKRTQHVDGGFNRLTLMHAVFALSPGAYRVRAVTPEGTEFLTERVGDRGFTLRFYETDAPDGNWELEDVVAGAGGTYSMGMAYHQYDIRLPDGARRSDHSHPVVR